MTKREYDDLSNSEKNKCDYFRAMCGKQFDSCYIQLITANDAATRRRAWKELGTLVEKYRKEHRCNVKARGAA